MTPKALKALNGSILKWEKIIAGTGTDMGADNCPLCLIFLKEGANYYDDVSCKGCPVAEKTGWGECVDTPYEAWFNLQGRFHGDRPLNKRQIAAAQAELDFLKSLLPAKKRKP